MTSFAVDVDNLIRSLDDLGETANAHSFGVPLPGVLYPCKTDLVRSYPKDSQ